MNMGLRLKDLGEKNIIKKIIKPLFNPGMNKWGVGDDCGIIDLGNDISICLSTDRVPADLISFEIGIINHEGLGYYLAILNISDLAACGAKPLGLLLNFAFEESFTVENLKALITGIERACKEYSCEVLGGDLSNSKEMSISATSVGLVAKSEVLLRTNSRVGNYVFCSDYVGLTPTAFHYFLNLKPKGILLDESEEILLKGQFASPIARVDLGRRLSESKICTSCMDNTDGASQSFSELSELNSVKIVLIKELIPIHPVSYKVAELLKIDIFDLVLSSGADFQLLGTLSHEKPESLSKLNDTVKCIGEVNDGEGVWIKGNSDGDMERLKVDGWNYFSPKSNFKANDK
jgi:thiamine-monophosphate kinase